MMIFRKGWQAAALEHMGFLEQIASTPFVPLTSLEREVAVFSALITCVGFSAFPVLGLHPPASAGPRLGLVFRLGLFQLRVEQTSYLLLHRLCSRVTFTPLSVVTSIAYIHLSTVTVGQVLTICFESQP